MRYNLNCVNIDYMSSNFAKWLKDNCDKCIDTPLQPSEQVFNKDERNSHTRCPVINPDMTLEDIFNAGYEQCLKDLKDFQQSRAAEENGG